MNSGMKLLILIAAVFLFAKFVDMSGPKSSYAVGNYDTPKAYTQPAPTYTAPLPYKCTTTSWDGPYKHDGRTYSTECR